MKAYLKTTLLTLVSVASLTAACKKDQPGTTSVKEVVPPPVPEVPQATLLPTVFTAGKNKITVAYTDKLSFQKIDYGDGSSDLFTYTAAGKPYTLQHVQAANNYTLEFMLNGDGRVSTAYRYDNNNPDMEIISGYYTFSYSSRTEPAEISYYNNNDLLISSRQLSYSGSGNLMSTISADKKLNWEYLYDDKNGIFKNAILSWLMAIDNQHSLFLSCSNNLKTATNTLLAADAETFTYTYNSSQYPETVVSLAKGITTTTKVTYKEIK